MNTQDPIARLGALATEDRAWILAALSPQARDELLRRTRDALAGGERDDDQAASDSLDAESQQCVATVDAPSNAKLTERLCSTPLNALVEVLAGEPIWLTAALLRASDWPWRAQLLERLPQVALNLTPSLDPAGAVLSASLAQSLLQRIADKAASVPAPVAVTRFEMLVQKIAARRVAAWRSL